MGEVHLLCSLSSFNTIFPEFIPINKANHLCKFIVLGKPKELFQRVRQIPHYENQGINHDIW